jgi:regulator of protease activity HflC (stomatin/prohibitin superfamily)
VAVYRKPGTLLIALGVAAVLFLLYQVWVWEVERVEVDSGKFLVRTHRWGKNLDEGQIIAPDDSYKGVQLAVLTEGRHFINPIFWRYEIHDMTYVRPGECLVLTRLFGPPIPADRVVAGQVLANDDRLDSLTGERGILRSVLGPGSYRINPYAFNAQKVSAVDIAVDQVGVRTLKVGKDPRELQPGQRQSQYVVPAGYRGVQQEIVPPGTYYINPYVESITPVEVRSHRVELRDIEFPSRDGFIIKPFMVVEYAVQPERAPELLVRLAEAGELHQQDATAQQQQSNEILQKVLLPHIRGYARIEGSNFDARDFILIVSAEGEGAGPKKSNAREAMQRALLEKVKPRCDELGVDIRAVTLADMTPPPELADQIAQRELARVELERNKVKLGQFRAEQELKAKEALRAQAKEKVEAETRLVQATTRAEQLKEVELSRLKQELANAQLKLDAAKKQAEATLAKGRAEANVIKLQNEAEVSGLREAVSGFDSIEEFAQYHILKRLSPALAEMFISDDSEFAKIFSSYMKPKEGEAPPKSATLPASTARNP